MFAPIVKVLPAICALVLVGTSTTFARPREWTAREAIAEAQHDIRAHKIKFYWHGGYASMPVGLPLKYAHIGDRYPHADGGVGCIVSDRALRERQEKYSKTYNNLMLSYVLQKQ